MHEEQTKFEYSKITDSLYLGTNQCCQTHFVQELLTNGVTIDISLEEERIDAPFGVESYIWIPVKDHTAPTQDQLIFGVHTIQIAMQLGKKVYVHCMNGHGRGPTLVAAYLMSQGMNSKMAIETIRLKRPSIHPEKSQLKALEEFLKRNSAFQKCIC